MNESDELGIGPRLLAIETTLRALVDHASKTDPDLRARIRSTAEIYLKTVPQLSELERRFAGRSRDFVDSMLRPPDQAS